MFLRRKNLLMTEICWSDKMGQLALLSVEHSSVIDYISTWTDSRIWKMKAKLIFIAFLVEVFTQNGLEIGEEIQKWEEYKVRTSR